MGSASIEGASGTDPSLPKPGKDLGGGRVAGASRGRAKGKEGALSNVVNQCPKCGRGWGERETLNAGKNQHGSS